MTGGLNHFCWQVDVIVRNRKGCDGRSGSGVPSHNLIVKVRHSPVWRYCPDQDDQDQPRNTGRRHSPANERVIGLSPQGEPQREGKDPDAVVDANLRLKALDNLF
jgi:hypothetical protein